MIELENGSNTVKLDDNNNRVNLSFSARVNKKTSAYAIDIPAFHMHFYVQDKHEIEKSAHESMVSFFNYWLNHQKQGNFLRHMSALGFSVKHNHLGKVAEPVGGYSSHALQVVIDRITFS